MRQHVKERQSWGYSIGLIAPEDLLRLIPNAAPGEIGAACFADQEGTVEALGPVRHLRSGLDNARCPDDEHHISFTAQRICSVQRIDWQAFGEPHHVRANERATVGAGWRS